MSRLVYSMMTSLDGYVADAEGKFGWGAPEDEAVHAYANAQAASVGTYLFGRRMYEVMSYWDAPHDGEPPVEAEYGRLWRDADKVVYSRMLDAPSTARTRVERSFDPGAVRALVAGADRDVSISGPALAAHALRAGLVDEVHPIVCPVVVGGGTRFYPEGVRLDLALLDETRFDGGVRALRYAVRR